MKIVIDIPEEDYAMMKLAYESGMGNSAMKRILQGTPIEQTNTTHSILDDIKAEIDNECIGYPPSADYYKAIKKAVRIIEKRISGKE